MNERSIFDLDSIIEWLSFNGELGFDADSTFDPDKDAEDARKALDDALEAAHMTCTDLEDAAGRCTVTHEIAGFNRGFRAGARLVLQMLAGNKLDAAEGV